MLPYPCHGGNSVFFNLQGSIVARYCPQEMKLLILIVALCSFNNAFAEPLATGTVTRISKSDSYLLRFKISEEAKPGLRFYLNIRFVLNDDTWIDGHLGCFPSGGSGGEESGGEISMWDRVAIPAGKTLKHVAVVAAVGDPSAGLLGTKPGEIIPRLDNRVLSKLEKEGGFVLIFPIKEADQERPNHDSGTGL